MNQKTINKEIEIKGVGLHTGLKVNLKLVPLPASSGIIFKRIDIAGCQEIPARLEYVDESSKNCTTLVKNGIRIKTCEHLLSCLYAFGIDNLLILIDNEELPALDGSASEFVKSILKSGIVTQNIKKCFLKVDRKIIFKDKDKIIIALPSKNLHITYLLSHSHPMIGNQIVSIGLTSKAYVSELAPARTFATEDEARRLKNLGLAKGGSIRNSVVIFNNHYSSKLRFKDEFARHKILDLIGDLSLTVFPIYTHIIALRTGHKENREIIKKIRKNLRK